MQLNFEKLYPVHLDMNPVGHQGLTLMTYHWAIFTQTQFLEDCKNSGNRREGRGVRTTFRNIVRKSVRRVTL